jgi:hypothetical protein
MGTQARMRAARRIGPPERRAPSMRQSGPRHRPRQPRGSRRRSRVHLRPRPRNGPGRVRRDDDPLCVEDGEAGIERVQRRLPELGRPHQLIRHSPSPANRGIAFTYTSAYQSGSFNSSPDRQSAANPPCEATSCPHSLPTRSSPRARWPCVTDRSRQTLRLWSRCFCSTYDAGVDRSVWPRSRFGG